MEDNERLELALKKILERYEETEDYLISQAYGDGGAVNPFPRLHRAVINQIDGGDATLSRYAIWANTVRDNLIEFTKLIESDTDKALDHLRISINSLSCFCDIQAHFDPFEHGDTSTEPRKMDIP